MEKKNPQSKPTTKKRVTTRKKTVKPAAETVVDGKTMNVPTLVAKNQEMQSNLETATNVANNAMNGIKLLMDNVVPKVYLKNETFLDKVKLYLEGKGSWVKFVIAGLIFAVTAFTGVGVAEILGVLAEGYEIITGLISGAALGEGILGTLFASKANRFVPNEQIDTIDVGTGKVKLK